MSDALRDVIEYIGEQALGGLWPMLGRKQVEAFMRDNPAAVAEATRRLRVAAQEGRL